MILVVITSYSHLTMDGLLLIFVIVIMNYWDFDYGLL